MSQRASARLAGAAAGGQYGSMTILPAASPAAFSFAPAPAAPAFSFAPAAAAGAGVAAPAAAAGAGGGAGPHVSGRQGPRLKPQSTGFSAVLAMQKAKKYTRPRYEQISDVHKQCGAVLEPPDNDTICWLCGFNINDVSFAATALGWQPRIKSGMLDGLTCEHVLPIKLAYTVLTLYQKNKLLHGNEHLDSLLHTEYEYAHNFCNFAKNDKYFITWPGGGEGKNFCSVEVNHAKLEEFLNYLLTHTMSGERDSHITFTFPAGTWASYPGVFTYTCNNIVEAYLIIDSYNEDNDWFAFGGRKHWIERWKRIMRIAIVSKMEDTINHLKRADDCGGGEQGRWSQHLSTRIQGHMAASSRELAAAPQQKLGEAQLEHSAALGLHAASRLSHGVYNLGIISERSRAAAAASAPYYGGASAPAFSLAPAGGAAGPPLGHAASFGGVGSAGHMGASSGSAAGYGGMGGAAAAGAARRGRDGSIHGRFGSFQLHASSNRPVTPLTPSHGSAAGAGGGHVEAALAELASLETALEEAIYDYNLAVENGSPPKVISALNDKQILAARAWSEMDEYIKSLGGGAAAPAAAYGSGAAAGAGGGAAPAYYPATAPAATYGGATYGGGTYGGGGGGARKKHTRRRKANKRKHRRSTRK